MLHSGLTEKYKNVVSQGPIKEYLLFDLKVHCGSVYQKKINKFQGFLMFCSSTVRF